MAEQQLPDWRRDPAVQKAQAAVDTLHVEAVPHRAAIKAAQQALQETEGDYQRTEASPKIGMLAMAEAWNAVQVARAALEKANADATDVYNRLSMAEKALALASVTAQAKAEREIKTAYMTALDEYEKCLIAAIEADNHVQAVYRAASVQFPAFRPVGLQNLRWRWRDLSEENLQNWRNDRRGCGMESAKNMAQRVIQEAKNWLAAEPVG